MTEDFKKIKTLLIPSTNFHSIWQMIYNLHHDIVPF
jgi:hypothetical protein